MSIAPPPLSDATHQILTDILSQTNEAEPNPGVDKIFYRARNPSRRLLLDALEQEGFISLINHSKYLVSLKGLFVLRNNKALEILSVGAEVFFSLQELYKEEPKKGVNVVQLSRKLQRSTSELIRALVYLRDAPMWGGYSLDLLAQDATIQVSESILDHNDLNSVLSYIWDSHLRIYKTYNPLIFFSESGVEEESVSPRGKADVTPLEVTVTPIGLSDAPPPYERDSLGYGTYADAIVDFLTNENTEVPFSLAISGHWGSGKTTLLEMIKRRLDEKTRQLPTVWFSLWNRNQHEEVWASFAKAIIESQLSTLRKRLFLRYRRFIDVLPPISVRLTWFAIAFVLFVGSAYLLHVNAEFMLVIIAVGAALASAAWPYAVPVWRFVRSPLLKLLTSSKGPDYDRKLGFQKEFMDDLSRLISISTSPQKPLYIIVDDLDRAPPPILVRLLEAMNIIVGQKQCVFVIGLDMELVSASIEAVYQPVIERHNSVVRRFTGREFIEKQVQLEFSLPELADHQIDSFLDGLLKPLGEKVPKTVNYTLEQGNHDAQTKSIEGLPEGRYISEPVPFREESDNFVRQTRYFSKCLPRNPRKIKRFINSYRLLAYIAQRRGLFTSGRIDLATLGAVIVLATEYPEIHRHLGQTDYKIKLSDIQQWINGGGLNQNYGLFDDRERYRLAREVIDVLLGSAGNIRDYLSLSTIIAPAFESQLTGQSVVSAKAGE